MSLFDRRLGLTDVALTLISDSCPMWLLNLNFRQPHIPQKSAYYSPAEIFPCTCFYTKLLSTQKTLTHHRFFQTNDGKHGITLQHTAPRKTNTALSFPWTLSRLYVTVLVSRDRKKRRRRPEKSKKKKKNA